MSAGTRLTCAALAALLLPCCGSRGPTGGGPGEGPRGVRQADLRPTVETVPDADMELLWKAAQGYMKAAFPLHIDDAEKRVLETHTIEVSRGAMAQRTRVTVLVDPHPRMPEAAALSVVAQRIVPRIDIERARDLQPLGQEWVLVGTDDELARFVAEQVTSRYLLLRQGRDPSTLPVEKPFPGLDPRIGGPTGTPLRR